MNDPPATTLRRRIVRGATLLAAAAVVGLTALRWVDLSSLGRPLARQLSTALGRPVRIHGPVRIDLAPRPYLAAETVVIESPPNHPSRTLAEIGRLELELDLWRLLVGVLAVERLRVVDVDVALAIDADGGVNWTAPARVAARSGVSRRAGGTGASRNVHVQVRAARFDDVRVRFTDARSGRAWSGAIDHLALSGLRGGPITVALDGQAGGGPVTLALRLEPPPRRAPARPYGVSFQGALLGAEVGGTGTVASPFELAGIDVGISAALADGTALAALTGWIGGPVGPAVATGRLSDADGSLGVEDLEVKAGLEHDGWINLSGRVADVAHGRGVAMTVRFGGDDLRSLVGRALPWLARLGPFGGAATVSERDGRIDVHGLVLTAGEAPALELALEGGIADLFGARRVAIATRATARDLASAGAALGVARLPALGPVTATGHIVGGDAGIGLAELDLGIGSGGGSGAARAGRRKAGGTRLRLTGAVAELGRLEGIDVALALHAKDLATFAAALGGRAPAIGPVEVSGRVAGSATHLASDRMTVRFNQTLFRANVTTTFADGAPPRLAASFDTALLRLEDFGVRPAPRDETGAGGGRALSSGASLDRPLAWRALRAIEGTMRVRASRAVGGAGLAFEDMRLAMDLRGGVLELRDLAVGYPGGRLAAAGRVDAAAAPPAVHLTGSGTGITLGALTAQLAGEELLSGSLDFDVDLRARGRSVQELLSGLGGEARLVVQGGTTAMPYSRAFVADMARALDSDPPDGEGKPINCVAGDFAIRDGVARGRTLVVDAPDVMIVGGGIVDVGRRMLDLTLTPMLRDGGFFAPLVQIAVRGPLDDPVYSAARRSGLTTLLSHLLRAAASPLRVFLFRKERITAGKSGVCAQALEQAGT
jgi:hypothetical protein